MLCFLLSVSSLALKGLANRKSALGPDSYGNSGFKVKCGFVHWNLRLRHQEGLVVEENHQKREKCGVFPRIFIVRFQSVC